MLISVVIPVYNSIKYMDECIGSVLAQRFDDYEIVLVDDGSADGSERRCDEYASRHDQIRVVHQENAGASAARNTGLKAARGEYIHFIDSDDRLSSNAVYKAVADRALTDERDIVFFRRERFTEGVGEIDTVQPEYKIDGAFSGDVLNHVLTEKYGLTMTCPVNKIFRRKLLIENNLYFTMGLHHEEDEWLPRVIACAKDVWFDKGVFYTVRMHPESLSRVDTPQRITDRACSKVYIADSGMAYMEKKALSPDTLSLTAEYYWDYLTDACVTCCRLSDRQDQKKIYHELKAHRRFFKSCRYLKSRNKRMMGRMFQILGIKPTVRFIGLRYGK